MPNILLPESVAKKLYFNEYSYDFYKQSDIYAINRETFCTSQIKDQKKKYVIKVDQEIKGRFKKGLVKLNATVDEIAIWINMVDPIYKQFIIEPMIENVLSESYLLIRNVGSKREIVFMENGGVDVQSASKSESTSKFRLLLDYGAELSPNLLTQTIHLSDSKLNDSIINIYHFYNKYHLTFLEINPLAQINNVFVPLDMLAKYDSCSTYLWSDHSIQILESIDKNNDYTIEEKNIIELGKKTGSSLKFKLLNPNSRIWFVLFGGGASVCFFDKWMKIAQLFNQPDLAPANYGEMSGNPTDDMVYQYMHNIFSLMAKSTSVGPHYLVIGGGIANFTLVDKTMRGIAQAIQLYQKMLLDKGVKIYARRGGPNYQRGLKILADCCISCNLQHKIFGPDEPMTSILDMVNYDEQICHDNQCSDNQCIDNPINVYTEHLIQTTDLDINQYHDDHQYHYDHQDYHNHHQVFQFSNETTCFIIGSQLDVVQNMLDFDYYTGRNKPSIVAIIDPNRRHTTTFPFFWKNRSILIPVYPNFQSAITVHLHIDGLINFMSYRSAYQTTIDAISNVKTGAGAGTNIKFVSILAEGMAENQTRDLILICKKHNVMLLGPSTIGAIIPGKIRIGNAGGKMDYIINNNLHKIGLVGIVTRSGGLLNELSYIASKVKLGIASAIAIGGDQYMGTTFANVISHYESDSQVKIIIMLGEIGGTAELDVALMVKEGLVRKPIIGLCLGIAADMLASDIQFGHAGSSANHFYESATYKNTVMSSVGIHVPSSWDNIETLLEQTCSTCNDISKSQKTMHDNNNPTKSTTIPVSFSEAVDTGLVRKQCNFFSSISNEKGDEITYNNTPVSSLNSIGNVIGHLWFKRQLPDYLSIYYEKILIMCADHGPCVSGAQNTIVTTRAGKDLISSLCSGLLTIGPKFGGAISDAAINFYYGVKNKESPTDFIKRIKLIPGIGHKHYSIYKPDNRVTMLSNYVDTHFSCKTTINFARSIENLTTKKKPNLILNADGFIAASIIDGFFSADYSEKEIEEILNYDMLNGFFVLARTIGLIGHHIDQKRLRQDLYRAPDYDVAYLDSL